MADLGNALTSDPTLEAIDRAIEYRASLEQARPYLGMSQAGEECNRALWYSFRWVTKPFRAAFLVKCAERGHRGELVQAERLRMVEGITVITHDPETGKQVEFTDIEGHFMGHSDGEILGILQAPKTKHVWEHKEKEEKFVNALRKIIAELGEKQALKKWHPVYYVQAQLYMHYSGLKRHYMTVSVPGGRETVSIRTEYDVEVATRQIARARTIIYAQNPFEKIGREDYFECRLCNFNQVCHQDLVPDVNCRTCLHSTPSANGQWHCNKFDLMLNMDMQRAGCASHLYIPSLVPGEVIDSTENSVTYKMKTGNIYINEGK